MCYILYSMDVIKVIGQLSNLYGFDNKEALILLGLDVVDNCEKVNTKYYDISNNKNDINIKPFDGIVRQECCKAVIYNHGLYTQCMNITDREFCSSLCKRQKYGNIYTRKNYPVGTYILQNGKKELNYEKVKKRLTKIKRVVINDSDSGIDSDREIDLDVDKKCRGRPKMALKEVEVKIDSIEKTIEDGEEFEEVQVKRQMINNKEYLLSDNNILYDTKTYKMIGKYLLGRIIYLDEM